MLDYLYNHEGQWLHPHRSFYKKNLCSIFMCHTLSISTYQHQYYQQLLPISTFHWLPNKHGGKTRECNVLHNNIYGKNEFSLCFGFVEQAKNKVYIVNWVFKLLLLTGSKTWKTRKFFPRFLNPSFRFWL